ncbi:leucine rich repeat (LRR) protein [Hallerella porci]|uniref:Leucine rich repeat (LRR) protein n=2 Tax=Hallerella porci TaxID=1945871 RepID=A0ABX5LLX6_9BACT|nr:leucine rich repeat (LRR) protein [Hallerella porci]
MWAGWNIAHVVLEEGITKIGSKFSQLFMEMKTLELPNSLTTISEDFIQSRTNLEYLKFPNNIDSLPGWTISNSPTLKYAKLPSKLKKIKSNAFIQDTSLAYLEIPAGVKEIATLAVNEKNIQKLVLLSDSYYTNVENAFASLFQSHNAPLLVLVCGFEFSGKI